MLREVRVDVAFKLAGVAGLVEARRLAPGPLFEIDAQMPRLAARPEFGGEGGERGLAIVDGVDVDAFGGRISPQANTDGK